ncbi:MAG: polysaccharide deacetylase family protein [Christensenellales bacterium]|jgi:peptidoglycan/xylan/chitin deacetylase (PgdA/CDA1 family)
MKTIFKCFKGGKFKVLTMSYDDGKLADKRLVAIFNKYGIKGSFHLNGGLFSDPGRVPKADVKALYEGHEVSAHTYTHPTISRCPLPMVAQQILEDRKTLEDIVGYPVRGMSYPNGSYSQDIVNMLPALGIEYSRIVGSSNSFALPENYHKWMSTCHHNHDLMENAKKFVALNKKQYLYMMYVWGHSYEFDNDANWDLIENFCAFAGGKEDTWYATNIEIVDYMNALDQLKFSARGNIVQNPSAMDLWLSVDGEVVRIPAGGQAGLF